MDRSYRIPDTRIIYRGNGLKTRGYCGCFKADLPNLVKIRRLQWKKVVAFTRETIAPSELLHKEYAKS